jgi:putative FmdB family regulatory protein
MPIYEYQCLSCKRHHEIVQKYSDDPLTTCPDCGGAMKKLISNTSFILKGSGWYKTDYAPGNGKKQKEAEKDPDYPRSNDAAETKSSAGPEETKTGKKAESKSEAA